MDGADGGCQPDVVGESWCYTSQIQERQPVALVPELPARLSIEPADALWRRKPESLVQVHGEAELS